RIVDETRREMDKLVADIRKIRSVDQRAADRVIQQSRDSLRKREGDLAEPMVLPTEDNTKPPKTVRPGDTVRIVSLDKKATVLSAPDARGEVQVQAGVMKVNVKLSDLRMAKDDTPQKGAGRIKLEKDRQVGMELDIRGMLVDDAILVVDRYIDNAALSGLSEINIIHGKGTGALRAGIQDYLRTNKRIKSFRLGNYGEGDAGVTVATLKPLK
ncbi:MAG: Smr/MutS family protein, partial [Clostridia bacterium]|nr:Smr/MutS family protein [Clostridia bacterium]